jgi:hypothetical protein
MARILFHPVQTNTQTHTHEMVITVKSTFTYVDYYVCGRGQHGQCGRYSNWIQDGQPRDRSLSPSRGKIFLLTTLSRPVLWPTQPHIQWAPWALSLGIKRPGREAEHSPPPSAEVKKMWTYTSTPPYASMAWCLII